MTNYYLRVYLMVFASFLAVQLAWGVGKPRLADQIVAIPPEERGTYQSITKAISEGQVLLIFDNTIMSEMNRLKVKNKIMVDFPSASVLSTLNLRSGVNAFNATVYMMAEKICRGLGRQRVLALDHREMSAAEISAFQVLEFNKAETRIVTLESSDVLERVKDPKSKALVFTKLWCDDFDALFQEEYADVFSSMAP